MVNETTDPPPGQLALPETHIFPVIPFSLVIYPDIFVRIEFVPQSESRKKLEEIIERGDPRAIAFLHLSSIDTSIKKPVGILASIKFIGGENFEFKGISRVEIIEFVNDKKKKMRMAKVRFLEDKPKKSELTRSDEVIVFGSLEAIYSLLVKLSELLPEKEEIKKEVGSAINYLSSNRRDLNTVYYYLPSSILRALYFVEDESLEKLLRDNDVNYRLQAIIDILKREIKIFEMRQILFEDPESFRNDDGGK